MRPPPVPLTLLAASLAGPLLVCALLSLARDTVRPASSALVLVLLVVGAAATGRRSAGLLTALSSAVWFDFFLVEPYGRLTIADRDDVETTVLLVTVGLAVSEIALRGVRHRARSDRRAGYLDGLVSAARMAAAGETPPDAVVVFVGQQIQEVLGVSGCEFVAGALGSSPRLESDGSVAQDGVVFDVDRSGLPTHDVVALPVASGGTVHGRYDLFTATNVVWPTIEQRRIAVTLAEQTAAALAARTP